jgi:dihydroorotate dehydrogenase (NAD+) catalytic subunit
MNARDALEFMLVGATAVQVGTANFVNPGGTLEIIDGMAAWLEEQGVGDVKALIGTLQTG